MARKTGKPRKPKAAPPPRRVLRWPVLAIALVVLGGLAAAARLTWPDAHGWHSLGNGLGRIRWAETVTGFAVEPPLAPQWVRDLRARGLPWPTDQPIQPLGAGFGTGGGEQTAAWYVIQSARPANELWAVDKQTLRLMDATGKEVPWPGGSGAALIDGERGLQYLYLGVPRELSGTGARLRFRLVRFEGPGRGPVSEELSLPF